MKKAFCLLSILFVISLPLIAQNEGLKELEDLRDKQNAMLEYSEEDMVEIPGKDIVMAPPEYFEYNDSIGGFFHPGSSTSIQILEIQNASMTDATKSLNQAYFETQGFHLKKDSVLQLNSGKQAKIYITDYTVNNEKYERIFFFTGNEKTIWINVNYPIIVKDLVYKPVISSLKTVKTN
ncbi:MAG: hypothetical protein PF590_00995 [Candidatus Delongbacteria bacterium]|nr:hypothetical protein [Candidatus Delongbacteria bacterium]